MHRGSWRYRRRERNEAALRAGLREIAAERLRFGYRLVHAWLRRETQSGFTERFNGKFRDEYLNQNTFVSWNDARRIIEAWRVD